MDILLSVLSAAFWGALVLSTLVLVHEGGHFLVARLAGIRVTEFFLGMPCRWRIAFKSRRSGTLFGVTPFLLGGYNRICGMEGEPGDSLLSQAFSSVHAHGRVRADELAAELGCDEDHAYALLATLVDMGSIVPYYDEELGEKPWQGNWPAAFETLARDAEFRCEYDHGHDFSLPGSTAQGEPHPLEDPQAALESEKSHTYIGAGFITRVLMLAAGPAVNILVTFALLIGSLMICGIDYNANSNVLGGVSEGSLAEEAGLRAGDEVVRIGDTEVSSWASLVVGIEAVRQAGGDFSIVYVREGNTHEATIAVPEGTTLGSLGVDALIENYKPGFREAGTYVLGYVRDVAKMVIRLLIPRHTMEVVGSSSSIVGISAMASEAASSGPNDLVVFVAAISLSLGLMNLLPIPPLDGGKIVIECIQLVLRRPLSTHVQTRVSYVGLAFFLFIFCFALKNDVVRILGL